MPYRLRPEHDFAEEFRRALLEQAGRAARDLEDPDPHAAAFGARKRLKKLRGGLRLARPGLGDAYAPVNAAIRALAHRLAGPRDAQMLIEALDGLALRHGPRAVAPKLRARLVAQRDAGLTSPPDLDAARAELASISDRITQFHGISVEHARCGLAATYRRGRREARASAKRGAAEETFHDWRKSVKYHWHHCRLLTSRSPEIAGRAAPVKALADALGLLHDLDILMQQRGVKSLHRAIDEDRNRLRDEALALGGAVYAPKPREIAALLGAARL